MSVTSPLINKSREELEQLTGEIDDIHHDMEALKKSIVGPKYDPQTFVLNARDAKSVDSRGITNEDTDTEFRTSGKRIEDLPESEKKKKFKGLQSQLMELSAEWEIYASVIDEADNQNVNASPEEEPLETINALRVQDEDQVKDLEEYLLETIYSEFEEKYGTKAKLHKNILEESNSSDNKTYPLLGGVMETAARAEEIRREAYSNLNHGQDYEKNGENKFESPEISAFEPECWREVYFFEEDDLHDWLEEEKPSEKDSTQHEYPIHFTEEYDKNTRKAKQPDALEELFVHEFKQPENRHTPGELDLESPDYESQRSDLEQINGYLNRLGLPAGLLIYAGENVDTKQYVVERSEDRDVPPPSNIYRRGDYNFEERIKDKL